MSDPVTIRERVLDALLGAGPVGLSMAAISGTVAGPWRARDVENVVRTLWQASELARRADGTFVASGKATRRDQLSEPGRRAARRLDRAVARVAKDARREGHDTRIRERRVDPGLLRAFCPKCRTTVAPKLDGTCARCGTQTGGGDTGPPKPRRRYRRRPLKEGQAGFGVLCPKCGGPKSKQAHRCRTCSFKLRSGRQLGPRPTHKPPKNISDELLLECRRLYASGLSIRQVAEQVYPQTSYASVNACKTSLFSLFNRRGWRLRPQADVTAARSFKHGRKKRGVTNEQNNAYRRWLAKQNGWDGVRGVLRPICKGVRTNAPGKGKPCGHHALTDSEYCWSHDPRFELERQAQSVRMRARVARPAMLPAAPFIAWLHVLRAELGRWRDVAILLDTVQVYNWHNGRASDKRPFERISVRAVRKYAERAGTTVEAIYGDVEQEAVAA